MDSAIKKNGIFGTRQRWRLYNIVNVVNVAELFTLKWLILCYVNFPSI